MSVSIAIVDYGAGNLRSIRRALEAAGAHVVITAEAATILSSDAVVFPGVGAAGAAMQRLSELALIEPIADAVRREKPFLGICLGMQLLFGPQEEGSTAGLGLLPGYVRSLRPTLKIPQIGWNQVTWSTDAAGYLEGDADDFYFVHSYVAVPDSPADVVATTWYGEEFPSIVRHGSTWGMQFHPEKSGPAGLRLVARWVDGVRSGNLTPLAEATA
jgi:imidazole glycerol phosphate synthase glutamine amidotransferase subunit